MLNSREQQDVVSERSALTMESRLVRPTARRSRNCPPKKQHHYTARFWHWRSFHTPQKAIGCRLWSIEGIFMSQKNACVIRKGKRDSIDATADDRVCSQTEIA